MKVRLWAILICVSASGVATAQTAREYFNELRDANAFTHYGDVYVCFPDDDKGGFSVIAKTIDIEKKMAAADGIFDANKSTKHEEYLSETPYFKGVASDKTRLYEKMDKNSDGNWSLEYKSPLHGKNVYMINWATGRYRGVSEILCVRSV
jgi:hypothetical protein